MSKLLLKNCMLLDKSKKNILIEDGKIKRITNEFTVYESDMPTIDISEKHVVPGFIDCHTHLGIIEEGIGKIQEGYDADLAIFNGNPFDLNSKVVITLIDGNVVFECE